MTYDELIAEAAAILRGPDIEDLLFYYAKQAVRDILKNPLQPIYEIKQSTNLTLAASATEVALPSDFLRPISIKVSGEEEPLPTRHPRAFYEDGWPDSATDQEPTEAAFDGTNAMFNGVFAASTTIKLIYQPWLTIPAASSGSVGLSDKFYDIILAHMVAAGFSDQRDQQAAIWEKKYAQRMNDLFLIQSTPQTSSSGCKTMTLER